MSVRPIFLQKDGAVYGTPGTYRALPPKMAGLYAGSDALEDITYYTVNASGEAELKTVKAYPFYVDSIAGGLDTSGDGTLSNPWRSVNYPRYILRSILDCLRTKYCCYPYVVLRIKGTVDYAIQGWGSYGYGAQKFIIEPWDSDFINIEIENESSILAMYWFNFTILKNIKINVVSNTDSTGPYCMGPSNNTTLNNVFANIDILSDIPSDGYGCLSMSNSIFYNSSIKYSMKSDHYASGNGFCGCLDSIFYGCNTNISNASAHGGPVFGFKSNNNSAFFNCNGIVSGISGCGFYGNQNSIFLNCTGNSLNRTDCDI